MYSNQYYYNNNNNTIPTHSRSSYNLQQYASANAQTNSAHAMQPQPISHSSRSLSHSNLRRYYSTQQQQLQHRHPHNNNNNNNNNNNTHVHPTMTNNSISNPCINMNRNRMINNGGIVLQNLQYNNNNMNNKNPMQMQVKSVCDTTMNSNLQQFAKYSSLQLQQVLSQYPQWLQKEYMRRLQRQYEELYVIEDPKIHHWSAICPRTNANSGNNITVNVNDENISNNISVCEEYNDDKYESCDYLSESATLSPSPIYPTNDIEGTTSPAPVPVPVPVPAHGHVTNAAVAAAHGVNISKSNMLTCFQILDDIKPKDNVKTKNNLKLVDDISDVNNKFEMVDDDDICDDEHEQLVCNNVLLDGDIDEIESEIEEVHDNADNVQSPKEDEIHQQNIKEQVKNGYYQHSNLKNNNSNNNSNQNQNQNQNPNTNQNMSQQQYQQAMHRYYQQKAQAQAYQRQLLLQQQAQAQQAMQQQHVNISHQQTAAIQHQTYLMQNKYVAQYVRQQSNNQYQPAQYYQNNNYNYCA